MRTQPKPWPANWSMALVAREMHDRRPDPLEVLHVVNDRTLLVASHECADDRDLEALRSFDHTSQVVVRGLPRGLVRVEVVRVIGEGRDLEAVAVQQAAHRLRVEILDVDVRYARVATPLAPARRPARDLECLEPVVVGPLRDLFQGEGGKSRRQQAEPHRTLAFTARSTSTQRRSRELRATASQTSISSWPSAKVG